jgi:N-methylhydantoinase A
VVALPPGPYREAGPLKAAFEAAYRKKFALTPPDVPVEFINVRVAARAPVAGSAVVLHAAEGGAARDAVKGRRRAYFPEAGEFVETIVYDRARLTVGDRFDGPAVIEEDGSTLVVGPGGHAQVAATGNLIVTLPR